MPIFALFFSGAMSALVSFLVQFVSRKVAVATAAITSLAVFTGVLLSLFNGIVAPLANSVFSTEYGQFLGLAFPPVAGSCMAAISSTWAGCTLYAWKYKATQLAVQA